MSDLNKKNINYGALNRFYQNLKNNDLSGIATEQYVDDAIDNIEFPEYSAGEGIAIDSANTISCTVKPIADVSTLPDAEENKDSVLRLEGDKQVYISKGNPITPTSRVPDNEQIGRACLIPIDGNGGYIYCGEYTITCADGELTWYIWGDYNNVQFYISEDDAEHATLNSKVYEVDYDSGDWSNKSASGITTTLTKSVIESTTDTIGTIEEQFCPMTYKMPDSVQIGNAYMLGFASGDAYGYYFYTGEEVEFEAPYQGHLIGYKWVKTNGNTLEPNPSIFVITEEKAEDMTYYNTDGDKSETNGFVYLSMNGNITTYGNDAFAFISTLNRNAADSEQVGNAYIYVNNISGSKCYYTGEIATINGVSGYKWETSNHSDFIITVGVKAEDLYTNKLRLAKGEIPVYINSTSSEIDYSRLSDGYETVQYKRSVDYQWQRIVTEDELDELDTEVNTISTTLATKANKVDFIIPVDMQTQVTDWTVLNNAAEGIYRVKVVANMMGTSVTMLEGWATVTNSMGTIAQTLVLTQMIPSAQGSPLTIHNRVSVNNGTTWLDYEFNLGVINDNNSSSDSTYSSNKINSLISALEARIAALENPNA